MKADDDDDDDADGDGDDENGTAEDQNDSGDVEILTKKQKVGLVLVIPSYLVSTSVRPLHADNCMDLVPSFANSFYARSIHSSSCIRRRH